MEFRLKPGETVIAEANTLLYMDNAVEYEARVGDGTKKVGLMSSIGRSLTGAGVFLTHFHNASPKHHASVAFTANSPGKILLGRATERGNSFSENAWY